MIKWKKLCLCLLTILKCCEGVQITVPDVITEGQGLVVVCTSQAGNAAGITLFENEVALTVPQTINGSVVTYQLGIVSRTDNGDLFRCNDGRDDSTATASSLDVQYTAGFTVTSAASVTANLNDSVTFTYTIDANPAITDASTVTLLKDGLAVAGGRWTVGLTSATRVNVACGDNGAYTLQARNVVGNGTQSTNVTLTVPRNVAPSCSTSMPNVSIGLVPSDVGLVSYVNGCPDTISYSCVTSGGASLPSGIIDVDKQTPVMWQRSDFTNIGLTAESVSVTCTATNGVGDSCEISLTATYDAASCGAVSGCLGAVLGVVLGIALIIGVAVVIIVIVVMVIKKRN